MKHYLSTENKDDQITGVTVNIIDETIFHVLTCCVTTAARMGHEECSYIFPEITLTFLAYP